MIKIINAFKLFGYSAMALYCFGIIGVLKRKDNWIRAGFIPGTVFLLALVVEFIMKKYGY